MSRDKLILILLSAWTFACVITDWATTGADVGLLEAIVIVPLTSAYYCFVGCLVLVVIWIIANIVTSIMNHIGIKGDN